MGVAGVPKMLPSQSIRKGRSFPMGRPARPGGPVTPEDKHLKHVQALVRKLGIQNIHKPARDSGRTLLFTTIVGGHLGQVRYLIESCGGNPLEPLICPYCWEKTCKMHGSVHSFKSGPLISAVLGGHLEVVKYLVSIAPNIVAEDDFGCVSMAAAGANKWGVEMLQCLLQAGGDMNSLDARKGYPPITFAALYGHLDVLSFLISQGKSHLEPSLSCPCSTNEQIWRNLQSCIGIFLE